ncbi:hypothetical protein D9758_006894 [Tetrapyrgos nigripes]|uniref:C2H2-type domain-containing protein n=1 Tax=Tetrapyrgos nigripes TaxID=182062 RepID=A0A8H5GSQ5_9AGAR|nr:hypothetical protein D9758_006894 [Tetrapyrgos nigripes]
MSAISLRALPGLEVVIRCRNPTVSVDQPNLSIQHAGVEDALTCFSPPYHGCQLVIQADRDSCGAFFRVSLHPPPTDSHFPNELFDTTDSPPHDPRDPGPPSVAQSLYFPATRIMALQPTSSHGPTAAGNIVNADMEFMNNAFASPESIWSATDAVTSTDSPLSPDSSKCDLWQLTSEIFLNDDSSTNVGHASATELHDTFSGWNLLQSDLPALDYMDQSDDIDSGLTRECRPTADLYEPQSDHNDSFSSSSTTESYSPRSVHTDFSARECSFTTEGSCDRRKSKKIFGRRKSKGDLPCDYGCGSTFTRQHDRLRHEVYRHNHKSNWTCSFCSKFFHSLKNYRNHKCPAKEQGDHDGQGIQWSDRWSQWSYTQVQSQSRPQGEYIFQMCTGQFVKFLCDLQDLDPGYDVDLEFYTFGTMAIAEIVLGLRSRRCSSTVHSVKNAYEAFDYLPVE